MIFDRNSFSSLPPDYEAVMNGVCPGTISQRHRYSVLRRSSRTHQASLTFLNLEEPPPSYDEVIQVSSVFHDSYSLHFELQSTRVSGGISTTQLQSDMSRLSDQNFCPGIELGVRPSCMFFS